MHRTLAIISDLWGSEHSSWWADYQAYFGDIYHNVILYDARKLADIAPSGLSQQDIHNQFLHGGVDKVISKIQREYDSKSYDLLGVSIGGYIAWQIALSSSYVQRLAVISATRLRYKERKPSAAILTIFGAEDEYKPDQDWTDKMDAVNIPRQGHNLYQNINILKPYLHSFFTSKQSHYPYEGITTDRYQLIDISRAGSKSVLAIKSDPLVHTYLEKQPLTTTSEAASFVDKITEGIVNGQWYYWGIQPRGEVDIIGTICLWNFSDDRTVADIGYELLPRYWGRGVMSECMMSVLDFGFEQLQLHTIEAYTHRDNSGSLALLKKYSFQYIADDALGNNYVHYALHRSQR